MIRYVIVLAACAAALKGQTTGIAGTVKDPQGRTVAGAQVRLYRQDTKAALNTETSEAGRFQFEMLAPGRFLLETAREGFQTSTVPVSAERGSLKDVDITLALAGVSQSVVVTAADQAQTVDEVSKAMSIVSREEIVNRDAFSLGDILMTTPGLQVFNGGGPGQNTSIRIRGLRPDAGAVLIDGLRFRDATTTQSDASSFVSTLNFIAADRVEVLRGSGSSLYGTNAVGGAVNVVTEQGGGPLHGDFQVEGGNLGFFRTRGTLGGGALGDRLKYTVGILHLNVMSGVDGQDANRSSGLQSFARYDITSRLNVSGRFWGSDDFVQTNNSPSTSGIPSANIPANGVIQAIPLSSTGQAALLAGRPVAYGNATFVPGVNDPDYRRSARFFNSAFILRNTVSSSFNWQANYQRVYTDRIYQNGPVGVGFQPAAPSYSNYRGVIHTAGVRGTAQFGNWMSLTGGYEWERERYFDHQDNNLPTASRVVESTNAQQNSNSAFFASQISLANRRLQIGLSGRAQMFNLSRPNFQYAGAANNYASIPLSVPKALTGDISIAYLLPRSNTKLRAHAGNAYRAPSLYERFGAGFSTNFTTGRVVFTPYGDPRLSPDRYNSGDVGVDQYLFGSRVRLSATAFYTRVVHITAFDSSGAITPLTDPYGRTSGYINGSGGISRGAELSVEARPTRTLNVSGSYTYTNANMDRDITVRGFYRVFLAPAHTATLVATKQWTSRFDTTVDVVHYGTYYSSLFAGVRSRAFQFPAFTKADLVASYRFWETERKSARVYGKVDNLLDRTYFPSGYINPGATFVTGLGYSF